MGQPVVHFEIHGADTTTMQSFYSDLFGWKVDSNNPMNYGMVETGGEGGINGGLSGGHGETGVMVYVGVNDLQGALDKAESLGGKTIMPVTEIPNTVTLAIFSDPDGNKIGLVKACDQ